MKKHTKIYMAAFGYSVDDFMPCEICENRAVDIHHIECRGMGGNPKEDKDHIQNIMAVCRKCHEEYGDVPELREKLKEIHLKFLDIHIL
jgi:hypothetical protein